MMYHMFTHICVIECTVSVVGLHSSGSESKLVYVDYSFMYAQDEASTEI